MCVKPLRHWRSAEAVGRRAEPRRLSFARCGARFLARSPRGVVTRRRRATTDALSTPRRTRRRACRYEELAPKITSTIAAEPIEVDEAPDDDAAAADGRRSRDGDDELTSESNSAGRGRWKREARWRNDGGDARLCLSHARSIARARVVTRHTTHQETNVVRPSASLGVTAAPPQPPSRRLVVRTPPPPPRRAFAAARSLRRRPNLSLPPRRAASSSRRASRRATTRR